MPRARAAKRKQGSDPMFPAIIAQIRRIPRGKVATYGDVAYAAGFPGAARQVAWALHSCPPGLQWHRVIGAEGKILCTGELGFEQRVRLNAEGVKFIGLRVAMKDHRFSFFVTKPSPRSTTGSSPKKLNKVHNRRK